jgi:hypothetical protein
LLYPATTRPYVPEFEHSAGGAFYKKPRVEWNTVCWFSALDTQRVPGSSILVNLGSSLRGTYFEYEHDIYYSEPTRLQDGVP